MSEALETPPQPGKPGILERRRFPSLIWLVPLVAALIGLSMLVHAWLSAGPEITIAFQAATGLDAGKTPVKYKDVTVGLVSRISLSEDGSHVLVAVSMDKSAENLVRADSRFWIVRPRIGLAGVSGIDTLFSGAYIGIDAGQSEASGKNFIGLETPPTIINGAPGKSFVLHADDLGSLDIGSPIYYRRIQVGRLASYQLDPDGRGVSLQIFIDAPYDSFVGAQTRFWNASGIDVALGANGLKLNTQSLTTLLAGGIAFATPAFAAAEKSGAAQTVYELAKDQQAAMAPPDGPAQYIELHFERSLPGLSIGAPVQFAGQELGRVVSINLDYDPVKQRFPSVVGIELYPLRLGRALDKLPKTREGTDPALFMRRMVEHGLRAQARSANLLTGQLYIAIDFVSNAPKVAFDITARPLILPTINGDFDQLQEQVANIVAKVDKIPLDSIGRHLDASLVSLDQTLKQTNAQVLPEATRTLQQAQQSLGSAQGMLADDAPLQQNLNQTLLEVRRAAQSVRELTDLLGRHPESLLRGRPDDPKPAPAGARLPANTQESSP
ncbi:PqiB family protein [Quatrionicoccus australiensis]|uniref:PqiB family protein n=1 Tax=Quatrionicoccus australiensis TaxID=138118 RepID=UPI001CFC0283|nr:MlaD family protein [Quatrionicoccus australiensis]MCB4361614.1 MCE family protein [Quatrionicoccus australiensis]